MFSCNVNINYRKTWYSMFSNLILKSSLFYHKFELILIISWTIIFIFIYNRLNFNEHLLLSHNHTFAKNKKTNQCNFQNEMLHVWARKIAFKSLKNHGNVLIKKSESPWRRSLHSVYLKWLTLLVYVIFLTHFVSQHTCKQSNPVYRQCLYCSASYTSDQLPDTAD